MTRGAIAIALLALVAAASAEVAANLQDSDIDLAELNLNDLAETDESPEESNEEEPATSLEDSDIDLAAIGESPEELQDDPDFTVEEAMSPQDQEDEDEEEEAELESALEAEDA